MKEQEMINNSLERKGKNKIGNRGLFSLYGTDQQFWTSKTNTTTIFFAQPSNILFEGALVVSPSKSKLTSNFSTKNGDFLLFTVSKILHIIVDYL